MNIKLNLAALQHVRQKMKGKTGEVDVLIIPVKENHLYDGTKGLYLDLSCFEIKNPKTDNNQTQTHLVKQNLPKEVYSAMSDEQRKQQPIFGNVYEWGGNQSSGEAAVNWSDPKDDLPF